MNHITTKIAIVFTAFSIAMTSAPAAFAEDHGFADALSKALKKGKKQPQGPVGSIGIRG